MTVIESGNARYGLWWDPEDGRSFGQSRRMWAEPNIDLPFNALLLAWQTKAACRDVDDIDFTEDNWGRGVRSQMERICRSCPVIDECLGDAIEERDFITYRAGTTGRMRRRMLNQPKERQRPLFAALPRPRPMVRRRGPTMVLTITVPCDETPGPVELDQATREANEYAEANSLSLTRNVRLFDIRTNPEGGHTAVYKAEAA